MLRRGRAAPWGYDKGGLNGKTLHCVVAWLFRVLLARAVADHLLNETPHILHLLLFAVCAVGWLWSVRGVDNEKRPGGGEGGRRRMRMGDDNNVVHDTEYVIAS